MGFEKYIEKNNLGRIAHQKSFKDLTTMRVGGKIRTLYYPRSIEALIMALNYLRKHRKKYFIMGNGSNIIASDRPFKSVLIVGSEILYEKTLTRESVTLLAFSDLRKINHELCLRDYTTFLNLTGIPASIGGALVMNAGALGSTIADHLLWVRYYYKGKVYIKRKEELDFTYRQSCFRKKELVILEASFRLIKGENVMNKYQEILAARKAKQPLSYPNSGSIFKNGSRKAYEVINAIHLVNYRIGKAAFSLKHANFIINLKDAKAMDIYKLIILAKKRALIYEKYHLETEVILLNFGVWPFFFRNL